MSQYTGRSNYRLTIRLDLPEHSNKLEWSHPFFFQQKRLQRCVFFFFSFLAKYRWFRSMKRFCHEPRYKYLFDKIAVLQSNIHWTPEFSTYSWMHEDHYWSAVKATHKNWMMLWCEPNETQLYSSMVHILANIIKHSCISRDTTKLDADSAEIKNHLTNERSEMICSLYTKEWRRYTSSLMKAYHPRRSSAA